jgi:hypothetical protein
MMNFANWNRFLKADGHCLLFVALNKLMLIFDVSEIILDPITELELVLVELTWCSAFDHLQTLPD